MTDSGVRGQIHGIRIDSFLQMAQMEKTTCTLTIKSGTHVGYMYLLKGDLIGAEVGRMEAMEAACEIISWDNSVIEIDNTCNRRTNDIRQPLMNVLMEGLRRKDEKAAAGPTDPTPPRTRETTAPAGPKPRHAPAGTPAPPRKPARKGRLWKLALAGVILIVCAGAAYYLLGMDRDKEDYHRVLAELETLPDTADQITLLKTFIDFHKAGEFTRQAEAKIEDLRQQADARAFEEVVVNVGLLPVDDNYETAAVALYNSYLSAYPDGRSVEKARKKIAEVPSFFEDAEFEKLDQVETGEWTERLAAYRRYLSRHPEGLHRKAVLQKLGKLSEARFEELNRQAAACDGNRSWDPCIAMCDAYIAAFDPEPQVDQAKALRSRILADRELTGLMEATRQPDADPGAARQALGAFLEAHPDTTHKNRIQEELVRLDRQMEQKTQWEDIQAAGADRRKSVSQRIFQLKRFLERHPDGMFREQAEGMLVELEASWQAAQTREQKQTVETRQASRTREVEERRQRDLARRRQMEQSFITRIQQSGNRFKVNGNGTVTDTTTGLMWSLLDSQAELGKCVDYASGARYVAALGTGGYGDWRLPTSGELARIYKNPPYFPADGDTWYWSSEAYVKGYHRIANIVTTRQETVFNIVQERQDQCGAVRAVRP